MIYKIKIRPKALKFIEKQDKIQRLRILVTKINNRGQIYK